MKEIFERRSIRKYTGKPIPKEAVDKMLKAAMAAPSAGNQQPWEFIVIDDKTIFEGIMKCHPYSYMLKEAQLAIVICADLERETHIGYWQQDCAAATENLLIEAQHLGIGAVWLGIYPRKERVNGLKELLSLPERVMPMAVVSLGYPAEAKEPSNRYDPLRLHFNKW
ncbi:MAG: nitroreductase family protein [Actinobacteria bacterium]|nr:nitroreductase family protein [Actinomycetota bacterium]